MEIENDGGPRGSEAEKEVKRQNQDEQLDQNMDQPSDDVRGTKRKADAVTPLLEAWRMLLSATVSGNKPSGVAFNDISVHTRTNGP